MAELLAEIWPYAVIVITIALTGVGLPIPEEVPVITAGVAASHGQIDPWLGYLCCVTGALLGDLGTYTLGRKFGRRLLKDRPWFARIMHAERERQMEELIRKHGWKVFFTARFLVGVRAPIYLAAGILRVPLRRFLIADGCSALAIVGLFFFLSHRYGKSVQETLREGQYALTIVVALAVLIGLGIFFYRRKHRRAPVTLLESNGSDPDVDLPPPERRRTVA